jgi:SSS family solute:Na+ symporter
MPTNEAHLSWLDYGVVCAYIAAMVGIGFYFSRKQGSADHYYAGNRRIPTWAVGISILATIISSVTFIAYPGTAYAGNWLLLVQGLMVPVVLLTVIWFIVPAYRHAIGISSYEYFEKRFSYASRLYASIAFGIVNLTKMGTIMYLLSLAISRTTGWNSYAVILVVGAATILYTWTGGMEAVIWTDVVQGFLFLIAGVLCVSILLFRPPGGPSAVVSLAYDHGKMGVGPYAIDFTKPTLIVLIINGLFYAFQNYTTNQTVVQRFLAARDDRAAVKATLTGVLLCVPTWALFMFIGTCLWSFYQLTDFKLPPDVKGDAVFPFFMKTQLPMGVTGLVLAGLMAAAMSNLSSELNCLSAVAVEDYYRRLRPASTDRQRLIVGKGVVLLCGAIGVGVSVFYVKLGQESLLKTVFSLYALFSAGVAGLFALAFMTTRANRRGVTVGMIACIIFTLWAALTTEWKWGNDKFTAISSPVRFAQDLYMLGVYSHIVLFVVGYLASLCFPHEERHPELTIYGWLGRRGRSVESATPVAA